MSDYFRVHSFNFEGHGGRPSEKEFAIETFAENIGQYMDENHLSTTHIFGYSMGGYAGLHFAKNQPDRIGKVVTLATKFDWNPQGAAAEASMLDPFKLEQKVPKFAQILKERHHPSDWKTVLTKTADMMLGLGKGLAMSDADFKEITCETLVLVGAADNMVSIAESEKTAALLPNGKFSILENLPHALEKVDTGLLAKKILDFLMP